MPYHITRKGNPMVYNPPRVGGNRRKGVEHRHTKDQDTEFFASRLAELKKKLDKLGPKTKANSSDHAYLERQITMLEKKL